MMRWRWLLVAVLMQVSRARADTCGPLPSHPELVISVPAGWSVEGTDWRDKFQHGSSTIWVGGANLDMHDCDRFVEGKSFENPRFFAALGIRVYGYSESGTTRRWQGCINLRRAMLDVTVETDGDPAAQLTDLKSLLWRVDFAYQYDQTCNADGTANIPADAVSGATEEATSPGPSSPSAPTAPVTYVEWPYDFVFLAGFGHINGMSGSTTSDNVGLANADLGGHRGVFEYEVDARVGSALSGGTYYDFGLRGGFGGGQRTHVAVLVGFGTRAVSGDRVRSGLALQASAQVTHALTPRYRARAVLDVAGVSTVTKSMVPGQPDDLSPLALEMGGTLLLQRRWLAGGVDLRQVGDAFLATLVVGAWFHGD